MKYLNKDVRFVSRNTIASDVWKFYEKEKEKLKEILRGLSGRICLTSDVWTACSIEGYICTTIHFVDQWKLNSKILAFVAFPPPHNGIQLSNSILQVLNEWGIERKIFSITLDNASANDNMQDKLRETLCTIDGLLCRGKFFHVHFCAHILNLIVQDGLNTVKDALQKVRESVKYVKGSESRENFFQEFVTTVGLEGGVFLCIDVSTRWNSTFLMLQSVFKYKRAFNYMKTRDSNYCKWCPSEHEWLRAEKICEILAPFNSITTLISGSNYPTSNLYFHQIWKIECLLMRNKDSDDEIINKMIQSMREKFDKYWDEYSEILSIGVALDLRMKLDMVELCFDEIDDEVGTRIRMEKLRSNLTLLYNGYAGASPPSSTTPHDQSSSRRRNMGTNSTTMESAVDDMIRISSRRRLLDAGSEKSQLEKYLEEPPQEYADFATLDVLTWWKDNKSRFPDLARMACDVLSIPITTVASESAFSIGSRVLNKYRSSLLPRNVQALICTRNWLLGYAPIDDEHIDGKEIEDGCSSRVASNVVNVDENEDIQL